MLLVYVITLFPELIESYCATSIIGRGQQAGVLQVHAVNPRAFATNKHNKVDDIPYGGGSGMVLQLQPLEAAYHWVLEQPGMQHGHELLVMTPAAPVLHQSRLKQWAKQSQPLVLVCGHYEGFDERLFSLWPHAQRVSLGSFVLTGGELAALCVIDAVSRLQPGVVGCFESVENDSFYNEGETAAPLLDCPHYTRPASYKGLNVPEVLTSGNHKAIAAWRAEQALQQTQTFRPDLL
jgi:tRNA (guanine37-N1)-methyltransferase